MVYSLPLIGDGLTGEAQIAGDLKVVSFRSTEFSLCPHLAFGMGPWDAGHHGQVAAQESASSKATH